MKGHTYRYFEGKPLFPFGHGLSYTQFFYGYLRSDRSHLRAGQSLFVTVPVGNVGQAAGTEIVQLYLERPADKEGPQQTLGSPVLSLGSLLRSRVGWGSESSGAPSAVQPEMERYRAQASRCQVEDDSLSWVLCYCQALDSLIHFSSFHFSDLSLGCLL